jgi:hypothetical protein
LYRAIGELDAAACSFDGSGNGQGGCELFRSYAQSGAEIAVAAAVKVIIGAGSLNAVITTGKISANTVVARAVNAGAGGGITVNTVSIVVGFTINTGAGIGITNNCRGVMGGGVAVNLSINIKLILRIRRSDADPAFHEKTVGWGGIGSRVS